MLDFLTSINLDFEYFSPCATMQEFPADLADITRFIPDTVRAFVDAGIPIIAGLSLKKDTEPIEKESNSSKIKEDDHAVIICGYKENYEGDINGLYVHDDQIGPYSKVKSASDDQSFLKWDNEWIRDPEYGPYGPFENDCYDEICLDALILPLYPKIRLSYRDIYYHYQKYKQIHKNSDIKLSLTTNKEFKEKIANSNIEDKLAILEKSLPRFMWVITSYKDKIPEEATIIDATSHKRHDLAYISYL